MNGPLLMVVFFSRFSGKPSKPTEEHSTDWAPSLHLKDDSDTDEAEVDVDGDILLDGPASPDPEHGHPVGDNFGDGPGASHHTQSGEEITNEVENSRVVDFEDIVDIDNDCVMPEEKDWANDSLAADFGVSEDIVNSTCVGECESEEYNNLVSKYDDLVRSRDELQEELNKANTEEEQLYKSHAQLRDELTNSEVDKLELSESFAKSEGKCSDYSQKYSDLEAQVESVNALNKQQAARIKL